MTGYLWHMAPEVWTCCTRNNPRDGSQNVGRQPKYYWRTHHGRQMQRLHLWEALYTPFQWQWVPGDGDIRENPHWHMGTVTNPISRGCELFYVAYGWTFVLLYSHIPKNKISRRHPECLRDLPQWGRMTNQQETKACKAWHGTRVWYNKVWEEYRKWYGLIFEFTTPYMHQQNGTVEKSLQTILDGTRTVMAESGLPTKYWVDAV